MSVLKEILDWSQDRPLWQRDALRRLVQNGELSDADVMELVEICKGAHGLSEQADAISLATEHIPTIDTKSDQVVLDSIFHHRGVNALAENQTLKFSPSLTVVYGDNAAGKTGYIRILKDACRARGQENILGNVVSGGTLHSPSVSIKYRVGDETDLREWAGDGEDDSISRVSVFDTQSAAVYLTEKTDVAFRPFGLDLFDKLVRTCKAVRSTLDQEQRALSTDSLGELRIKTPEGTAVSKLLANLSSLTNPATVQSYARLSPEEISRLDLLEKSLRDLEVNDPAKLIRQLNVRAARVKSLVQHLAAVESILSDDAVAAVFKIRAEGRRKAEDATRLREMTFPEGVLAGTGDEAWSELWRAAQQFSDEFAYRGGTFPFTKEGARCVLCQQNIDSEAAERLNQFQEFVISSTERELRDVRQRFYQSRKELKDCDVTVQAWDETIQEMRIDDAATAEVVSESLKQNENRRAEILAALEENRELSPDIPSLTKVSTEVGALVSQIENRAKTLDGSGSIQQREKIAHEALELRARRLLAENEQLVLDEIEKKKQVAAYELCLNDTKTQAITQKSTSVTKTAVTGKLEESFAAELKNLSFSHVEVEMNAAGGAEGVLYHRLNLKRAPGIELPNVVSEGEQRCLSIAAFFAELSTAEDRSGIVFDDPVSSLDYRWREGVAQRLVREAQDRQVIVFTHDVVFLLLLKQFAQEFNVEQVDQHVRQLAIGAGVCAEELPWVAMPIKKKVGFLNKMYQEAEKLHRDGHQSAYEKEASYIYGLLREAWERALEEVLLGGVVERYRPGVQTQQVKQISDITDEDCNVLNSAMTKCSKWLPGHDQAAAAMAPSPEPAALKDDIDSLQTWVSNIRKRRQ